MIPVLVVFFALVGADERASIRVSKSGHGACVGRGHLAPDADAEGVCDAKREAPPGPKPHVIYIKHGRYNYLVARDAKVYVAGGRSIRDQKPSEVSAAQWAADDLGDGTLRLKNWNGKYLVAKGMGAPVGFTDDGDKATTFHVFAQDDEHGKPIRYLWFTKSSGGRKHCLTLFGESTNPVFTVFCNNGQTTQELYFETAAPEVVSKWPEDRSQGNTEMDLHESAASQRCKAHAHTQCKIFTSAYVYVHRLALDGGSYLYGEGADGKNSLHSAFMAHVCSPEQCEASQGPFTPSGKKVPQMLWQLMWTGKLAPGTPVHLGLVHTGEFLRLGEGEDPAIVLAPTLPSKFFMKIVSANQFRGTDKISFNRPVMLQMVDSKRRLSFIDCSAVVREGGGEVARIKDADAKSCRGKFGEDAPPGQSVFALEKPPTAA